ncbi:MAG: hypothetical protein WAP53_09445 [Dysgonamonadaceae bacterium]
MEGYLPLSQPMRSMTLSSCLMPPFFVRLSAIRYSPSSKSVLKSSFMERPFF